MTSKRQRFCELSQFRKPLTSTSACTATKLSEGNFFSQNVVYNSSISSMSIGLCGIRISKIATL